MRAFTIWPSEVLVASGSRYRATSKARAFRVRSKASGFIGSGPRDSRVAAAPRTAAEVRS